MGGRAPGSGEAGDLVARDGDGDGLRPVGVAGLDDPLAGPEEHRGRVGLAGRPRARRTGGLDDIGRGLVDQVRRGRQLAYVLISVPTVRVVPAMAEMVVDLAELSIRRPAGRRIVWPTCSPVVLPTTIVVELVKVAIVVFDEPGATAGADLVGREARCRPSEGWPRS